MRYLVVLLLLLPVCLSAQKKDVDIFGKGWYLSLTVQPERDAHFNLRPNVTANDTLSRAPNGFLTRFARRADTIELNGVQELYYSEPNLDRKVRREQAILELLSRLTIHYRFHNGIEISSGLYYLGFERANRTSETSGLPEDFYYISSKSLVREAGISFAGRYNFMKRRRFQPYAGLRLTAGVQRREVLSQARVFPELGRETETTSAISERFRINTILNYEMHLLTGFNFQVGSRLSVGAEAFLSRFLIPIPRALQVRYRLGNNREEAR